MTVGIVGLGLIGGSMAKSIKARTAHTVFGCDLDQETMMMARMCGAIDAPLTAENLKDCDLVLVAIRPAAAVKWVKEQGVDGKHPLPPRAAERARADRPDGRRVRRKAVRCAARAGGDAAGRGPLLPVRRRADVARAGQSPLERLQVCLRGHAASLWPLRALLTVATDTPQ